jgi:hypothetical protein
MERMGPLVSFESRPLKAKRRITSTAARRSWGSFGASGRRVSIRQASRRRARTRGFATPAFAGCAFIEGW